MESRNPSRARLLSGGRVQRRLRQPIVVHTNGLVGMESRNPIAVPTPKWWKSPTAFEAQFFGRNTSGQDSFIVTTNLANLNKKTYKETLYHFCKNTKLVLKLL
ncbi:hypothetical protein JTE90_013803 [Oedothorax gibbosus]|uniref:Uncharacterized protein n=1 Tax=Oedothorax gibbosus TaxID=931172 RepID=A0AAV6VJL1_9ARAC|nr:hypothetical protein JTE90_013803 [Oedothorax gibbosus]